MKRQKILHDFWLPKTKTTKADATGRSDIQKSPANQECGYMQRFSLERSAAITLTQTLVDRLKGLDITKEHDRVRLVEALVSVAQPGTSWFCCSSSRVLQKELHKVLLCSLMSEDLIPKAPVFLTIMLALCWDVEVKMARKNQLLGFRGCASVSQDTSCSILKVIEEFQEHWATVDGDDGRVELEKEKVGAELEKEQDGTELENGGACVDGEDDKGARKQAPLPTKSLVFEFDEFHDETFLPRLVEKMPNLQSVSLPYRNGDAVHQALARHCTKLQEIKMSDRIDVLSFLFGVPQNLIKCDITKDNVYCEGEEDVKISLIDEFCEEGEDLRQKFVPQFPNLQILNVDLSSLNNQAYILIHMLQPKMVFISQNLLLEPKDVADYRRMWKAVHGPNSDLSVLPITRASLSEDLCKAMTQPESGQDLVQMFSNLCCLDVREVEIEGDDDMKLVKDTISLFPKTQVTTLSLPIGFLLNLTHYGHLEHLQLSEIDQTSLYTLLDSLPTLRTLNVTDVYVSRKKSEKGYKRQTHTKLTTLCIPALSVEGGNFFGPRRDERGFAMAGLFFILRRLPNLRSLCLCRWLNDVGDFNGANIILQGALIKADLFETPILTHLEELCCLEYGLYKCTKEGVRSTVFNLVRNLPALRRLVLPNSDGVIHLTQSLEYLQKSHVELQFCCTAERVFGVMNPHT